MDEDEQKERNVKEDKNLDEQEIYEQKEFNNEFNDLLNKINNEDAGLDDITSIDLDFLKNDYIELYDLKKLLNEPKYHIAKFKILFLDFINLKDYFYKTFASYELKNEEKNKNNGTKNLNTNIINVETNRNNNTQKEKELNKNKNKNEFKNEEKNISEKKLININNNQSIDKIKDKQMKEKEEIIYTNNQQINEVNNNKINEKIIYKKNQLINKDPNNEINKENTIKSNNELIGEISSNQINISKESIINQSKSNIKNNKINLSRENNINNSNLSKNKSQTKSNSFSINSQNSSLKLINKTKTKDDSSELSSNKFELSKNESTLRLALTDMEGYIQKDKINQFTFKYIKKELGLDEYEKVSGTSYEDFVRNSFKIMLMMIIQNNINFENPKKVKLYDLINFYVSKSKEKNNAPKESNSENKNIININNLKLQTNIHNIILTNLIDNQMEIDIVVEIETNVISKLVELFPKNIFFVDKIFKNKGETNSDKITLVAEIARNIIVQGTEKLKQAIKYAEFISILNLYKDNLSEVLNSKVLKSIFDHCKMSEATEKVFCLITNGDYPILKFVLNDILKEIFEDKNNITNIKEYINQKIINNEGFHKRIEEQGVKFIEEKIYDIYLMFDTLKQNKIKFFVLYIGDIYQNFYQQNLICNMFFNKNKNENMEFEKVFNSFKDKYNLKDIKKKTRDLKNIISSFNQKIDSITEKKFSSSIKELESSINIILDLFNTNKYNLFNDKNYKKIGNKIKLDLIFNFLGEVDESKKEKYKNLEKKYNFISSIESYFFEDWIFTTSFNKDLAKSIEPTTFKIYVIDKITNNKFYNILMSLKSDAYEMKKSESYNVRYICYYKVDGKYKIDSNTSNFQNIFDKTFININKYILEEIDNLKKKIKYSNKKNEILSKDSLINKLKDEFDILRIKEKEKEKENTLFEKIKNFNCELDEIDYKTLIEYFIEAFNLIEKDIKLITEKREFLFEKFSKLFENIICRRIYAFIIYKIICFINEKVYKNLKEELNEFIISIESIENNA